MRFISAALYLIIIVVLAGWLSLSFCEFEIESRDKYVRESLAEYGISVRDTDYAKDTLSLYINSDGEKVTANDIMNIRKLLNALRCVVFDENIYNVSLVSPSGKTVYSTLFYNIYTSSETVAVQYSGGSYDEVMKKYFLKYDIRKNGYTCPYIGFYDTIGMESQALYMDIVTTPDDLATAISDFISSVTDLNEEGSGIFRYSAAFYNGDDIMAVVSRDIIYGDVVYWKAPDYSAIKTMFG